MERKEFEAICATYPELRHALADAFGHKLPLGKLSLKPNGIIDSHLLRNTPEEYQHVSGTTSHFDRETKIEKHIPSLFVVWGNGTLEKSTDVSYRCVGSTHNDWTNDCTYHGEMEWDENEVKPIAHHFINRRDVRYIILLEKMSHGWRGQAQQIDSLNIKMFFSSSVVDIQATARAIMSYWEEYGDTNHFEDDEDE